MDRIRSADPPLAGRLTDKEDGGVELKSFERRVAQIKVPEAPLGYRGWGP